MKDFEEVIVGISFVESSTSDGPTLDFPKQWNKPLKHEFVRKMKVKINSETPWTAPDDEYQVIVAKALLPTLRNEMDHLNMPEIIRRPRETDVRTTCGNILFR